MKNRDQKIQFSVTRAEKDKIYRLARGCNVSVSTFARKQCLNQKMAALPQKELGEIYSTVKELEEQAELCRQEDAYKKLGKIARTILDINLQKDGDENYGSDKN